MDNMILIGSLLFGIGLLIQVVNAKWSWKLGGYYASKNRRHTVIGWLFILIGLGMVIYKAWLNGQLS